MTAILRDSLIVVCGLILPLLILSVFEPYPEVTQLVSVHWSQSEYVRYFSDLAHTKGATYAFEILRRIHVPAGVNIHGVGHAIGDILYTQEGTAGMATCTQEFRNACSHSIVIQALIEKGAEALNEIKDACSNAPGGMGAYAICFHGVGHGLVASLSYDFKHAVLQCEDMTPDHVDAVGTGHRFMNAREECVGGAVMEMVAGSHDEEAHQKAIPVYMPVENPFRPCIDAYVPKTLRSACLLSLTQRFFGYAGISEDLPLPDTYLKAMDVCELASDSEEKIACYGGFGKEFVFYASQFNKGDVKTLSERALRNIWEWCGYAQDVKGIQRCASIAVDSLFWAGQNDPHSAVQFCSLAPDERKDSCFEGLVEDITYFFEGNAEKQEDTCALLPQKFREGCKTVAIPHPVLLPSTPFAVTMAM